MQIENYPFFLAPQQLLDFFWNFLGYRIIQSRLNVHVLVVPSEHFKRVSNQSMVKHSKHPQDRVTFSLPLDDDTHLILFQFFYAQIPETALKFLMLFLKVRFFSPVRFDYRVVLLETVN